MTAVPMFPLDDANQGVACACVQHVLGIMAACVAQTAPQILKGETFRVFVYGNSVVTYDTRMLHMVRELQFRELILTKKYTLRGEWIVSHLVLFDALLHLCSFMCCGDSMAFSSCGLCR